ncbi:hypothetical protein ACNQTB_05505 [Corynebacterium diphtheriae]
MKKEFLELWLTDDEYEDLEALDYVQDLTYKMLLKYAGMEPRVDISPFLHKAA